MTDKSVLITIDDFRVVGICPKARHWFANHGLDWRKFAKQGIPVEELRDTNDQQSNVDRLEKAALERMDGK